MAILDHASNALLGDDELERNEVLLLEDDPTLGDLLERSLIRRGCCVHRYSCAEDLELALGLGRTGVLVSDVRLSGRMSGLELVERLRARGDDRPALIISGAHDAEQELAALAAGVYEVLHKPFSLETLARLVEDMIASATDATTPSTPAN